MYCVSWTIPLLFPMTYLSETIKALCYFIDYKKVTFSLNRGSEGERRRNEGERKNVNPDQNEQ